MCIYRNIHNKTFLAEAFFPPLPIYFVNFSIQKGNSSNNTNRISSNKTFKVL